ncbi:MAG: HD domain-containing protein [Bacteroidota bacterium]
MRIFPKEILQLNTWFDTYTGGFIHNNPSLPDGYALKIKHTQMVCKEMESLGKSLLLDANQLRLAHMIALFHDIGRFEQYKKYQSFSDKHTENHALLGVKVLKENKVLDHLHPDAKAIVFKAIQLHNVKALPSMRNKTLAFYAKMIRDADKLDIFPLTVNHYQNTSERNPAIELGLSNTSNFSEDICHQILEGVSVDYGSMKSLNDFKLVQLGWVFDINFNYSLLKILNCGYIESIAVTLPNEPLINKVILHIHKYISERLNLQN